ncbi:MAG TPA: helix-turn-helix domain-containing protein [Bacteroidales bacterium]|mgnify:FL=1|nr:helix-turn-helix domain-containing protein [Bacteroidales bacterium]HQP16234.1 helix-turn-helix domain-containing protein [Bacteroidales bacterium]
MYKYEIADKIGISMSTLSRWINGRYFTELASLGYKKSQKYLTPKQIIFLSEKLDFFIE